MCLLIILMKVLVDHVDEGARWRVSAGGAAHRPGEGGVAAAESREPPGNHQHQDGP